MATASMTKLQDSYAIGWVARPGAPGWVVDSTLQRSNSSGHVISRSRDPKFKNRAMRPKEESRTHLRERVGPPVGQPRGTHRLRTWVSCPILNGHESMDQHSERQSEARVRYKSFRAALTLWRSRSTMAELEGYTHQQQNHENDQAPFGHGGRV